MTRGVRVNVAAGANLTVTPAAARLRHPDAGPRRGAAWHAIQLKAAQAAATGRTAPDRAELPSALKAGVERLSGFAMGDVRIHRNSSEPAKLGALAYTQGGDIHLGPGQERHLPHEAWHVVQQKQGRVGATSQLNGAPLNEESALEAEADRMGALAGRSPAAPGRSPPLRHDHAPRGRDATVQRKTAASAGLVAGYQANGEAALYNIAPAVTLPEGIVYEKTLATAFDTKEAMNTYIEATRPVGTAVRGHKFLDFNEEAPALPGRGPWHDSDLNKRAATRANYADKLAKLVRCDAEPLKSYNYDDIVALTKTWARNQRESRRGEADLPLIDPFITKIAIPQINQSGSWIFETNFSEAALGYITRISVPAAGVTGRITASPDAFRAVETQVSGSNAVYSPSHDTGTGADVGTQIAAISKQATHLQNHPGLDAVAKWAAEGARFEPVRQLGPVLKVNSRFYTVRDFDHAPLYLSFQQLYANWGDWFDRGYGIAAAAVRTQALAHAQSLPDAVDLVHDYDLDKGRPASDRVRALPREIQAVRDRMNEVTRRKAAFAADPSNKQKAIKDNNEAENQLITDFQRQLLTYQKMYPDLYRPPEPPPLPAPPAPLAAAAEGDNPQADAPGYFRTFVAVTGLLLVLTSYYLAQAQSPSSK